jgi:hypothetical protein
VFPLNAECVGTIRHGIVIWRKGNGDESGAWNAQRLKPLLPRQSGDSDMATKQGKKDNRLSDKEAMHIAEATDVSPKQAKDLVAEHGKVKGKEEAKNFKAEG